MIKFILVLLIVVQQFQCFAEQVKDDEQDHFQDLDQHQILSMQISDSKLPTKYESEGDYSQLIAKRTADTAISIHDNNQLKKADDVNENSIFLLHKINSYKPKWTQILCNFDAIGHRSKSSYMESRWNEMFIVDFLRDHHTYMNPRESERFRKEQNINNIILSDDYDEPRKNERKHHTDYKIWEPAQYPVSKNTPKILKDTKITFKNSDKDVSRLILLNEQSVKNKDIVIHNFPKRVIEKVGKLLSERYRDNQINVPTSLLFQKPFAYSAASYKKEVPTGNQIQDSYKQNYESLEQKAQQPLLMGRKIEGLKLFNRVCSHKNCFVGWESGFSTNNLFNVPRVGQSGGKELSSSERNKVYDDSSSQWTSEQWHEML